MNLDNLIPKQPDNLHLKFPDEVSFFNYLMQNDLYNTKTNEYAFAYNDANSICVYNLPPHIAVNIHHDAIYNHTTWSSVLSAGGQIHDFPDNKHWCEDSYASEYWIKTKDFDTWYQTTVKEN